MNPFRRDVLEIVLTPELCSDVAPFILDELDPRVRAMIEHAAKMEVPKANAMIDAIIADREVRDAVP